MHPELVSEQEYLDQAYVVPRGRPGTRPPVDGNGRSGTRWHQPGPIRAGGHLGGRFCPTGPARHGRRRTGLRSHRPGRRRRRQGRGAATTSAGSGSGTTSRSPWSSDWRAPVAEAFYRATGRMPMGLERRRHFVSRGRELLAIEDELFGDVERFRDEGRLRGEGALIAALETARTGRLGDIVGTIQTEQDLVIRGAPSGCAGRAGRAGYRQDRRGAPPGRLPALHEPLPARRSGRPRGGTEPPVPGLHRAGPAVAR